MGASFPAHTREKLLVFRDPALPGRRYEPAMYYGAVQSLGQRVAGYLLRHQLLKPGDRVGVAVSGGPDSVALLRVLLDLRGELGVVLSVVHFNHKLRAAESDQDEQFVAELASRHKLQFHHSSGEVRGHAARSKLSIEAAARELRHRFFSQLIIAGILDKVATAHTADDQAETVLLRIIRGTGVRGLSSIRPSIKVGDAANQESGAIVRPVLSVRRQELSAFLTALSQSWREDSSNIDPKFTRNRVRKLLIPMLEREFNPAMVERLAEISEIARGEEEFWQREGKRLSSNLVRWTAAEFEQGSGEEPMQASIDLPQLDALPVGVQRRILHQLTWNMGIPLPFKHIEEILELARDDSRAIRQVGLPRGWRVERIRNQLQFLRPNRQKGRVPADYEYRLSVPGKVVVWEAGVKIEALFVTEASSAGYNSGIFLDPGLIAKELKVRNWRAGDRFWPAHAKRPKKVKELLQRRQLRGPERKLWPVVLSGEQVIWMKDFPPPSQLEPGPAVKTVIVIRHQPMESGNRKRGEPTE
jgi:tRNA(Ile)-lysidine synthase